MDDVHAEAVATTAEDARGEGTRDVSGVGTLPGTDRKTAETEGRARLQATQVTGKCLDRSFVRWFVSVCQSCGEGQPVGWLVGVVAK